MPPLPAAAGGGPGQALVIRFDVRLSAYVPHVSHHCNVPDSIRLCLLPPLHPASETEACRAGVFANPPTTGFGPPPGHFLVANFTREADLALHLVHSQQRPVMAR